MPPSRSAVSWSISACGRAAEGVHGLGVGARLGGVDPAVHDPLVPDPRREAPQVDGDEEVADRIGLLRRPHPVAEDLVQEAIAAAPGPVEDEAAHAVRMRERQLLGDRAAHRGPHHVGSLEPERIDQRGGVGGEVGDPERPVGRRRPSHASVVEGRHPVAVLQSRDLVDPARALVGEPGDEQDVVALALLLDPQVDAVRGVVVAMARNPNRASRAGGRRCGRASCPNARAAVAGASRYGRAGRAGQDQRQTVAIAADADPEHGPFAPPRAPAPPGSPAAANDRHAARPPPRTRPPAARPSRRRRAAPAPAARSPPAPAREREHEPDGDRRPRAVATEHVAAGDGQHPAPRARRPPRRRPRGSVAHPPTSRTSSPGGDAADRVDRAADVEGQHLPFGRPPQPRPDLRGQLGR